MVRQTLARVATLAAIGSLSATIAWSQDAAPAAAPAPAEPGVEEIIVTSRLREESIQDVPIAVQHFGQEAIEALSPSTLRDFDGLTPNVFIGMNTAGPGASAIYIRGLGYADIEKTQVPNVGVVLDGVFVPSSTGQLIDTFDIESIEINRGPQAILWGRNTSGGTIVVRRGQPKLGEWDARLLTTYGNYDGEGDGGAFKVQAVANIPLTAETLALRVGYTYKNEDGYSKNLLNGDNRGGVDYNAFNAKLLFQPTESLSMLLNWDWIRDRSDIPPQDARWDGESPYQNRSDRVPSEKAPYDVSDISLELNYELPFEAKLTSITSYWKSHDLVYQDFDAGRSFPTNPTANDPQGVFARLHTRREQQFDVFSQEIRLVGDMLDNSLHYSTGFYYSHDNHDFQQRTEQQLQIDFSGLYNSIPLPFAVPCVAVFGAAFPVDGSTVDPSKKFCAETTKFKYQESFPTNTSWALFGALEYELPWVEGLRANFGLRYIKEQKDFKTRFGTIANSNIVGSVFAAPTLSLSGLHDTWDDVVFEAGVGYQVLENVNTYYRFAQGFRSGGFSIRGSQPAPTCTDFNPAPPPCPPGTDPRSWSLTFDPETVDSHEIGLKTTWLDGRLVANFAGFLNTIKGSQGSSIISGVSAVGTNTLILNGGSSEVYGFELQSSLEILEGLNFDFNLGWQKGEGKKSVQSTHNLAAAAGDTVCNATSGLPKELQSEATCGTITFNHTDLSRTPELTWSIGGNYRRKVGPGEIVLGTRLRHNDFFWIIPRSIDPATGNITNTPVPQNGYTLLDANVSYEFQVMEHSVRVGFVGHNLTDKQYKEQELPLGPGGFRGWGAPRYVGGELEIQL